jgi:hypothetical protein
MIATSSAWGSSSMNWVSQRMRMALSRMTTADSTKTSPMAMLVRAKTPLEAILGPEKPVMVRMMVARVSSRCERVCMTTNWVEISRVQSAM